MFTGSVEVTRLVLMSNGEGSMCLCGGLKGGLEIEEESVDIVWIDRHHAEKG